MTELSAKIERLKNAIVKIAFDNKLKESVGSVPIDSTMTINISIPVSRDFVMKKVQDQIETTEGKRRYYRKRYNYYKTGRYHGKTIDKIIESAEIGIAECDEYINYLKSITPENCYEKLNY